MDKIIHLTATLQCDARHAFELFTVNRLLESWLTKAAEVEPVMGGKYELFWEPNDRENNSAIGCRVTAIQPNQFLSFEWRSTPEWEEAFKELEALTNQGKL